MSDMSLGPSFAKAAEVPDLTDEQQALVDRVGLYHPIFHRATGSEVVASLATLYQIGGWPFLKDLEPYAELVERASLRVADAGATVIKLESTIERYLDGLDPTRELVGSEDLRLTIGETRLSLDYLDTMAAQLEVAREAERRHREQFDLLMTQYGRRG